MAYLLIYDPKTCYKPHCTKTAVRELRNEWNGTVGFYCLRHADAALEDLRVSEARSGRAAGNDTIRRGSAQ